MSHWHYPWTDPAVWLDPHFWIGNFRYAAMTVVPPYLIYMVVREWRRYDRYRQGRY